MTKTLQARKILQPINDFCTFNSSIPRRGEIVSCQGFFTRQNHAHSVVKLLLNAGADSNTANTFGDTPFSCAARKSNREVIIGLLLDTGAEKV